MSDQFEEDLRAHLVRVVDRVRPSRPAVAVLAAAHIDHRRRRVRRAAGAAVGAAVLVAALAVVLPGDLLRPPAPAGRQHPPPALLPDRSPAGDLVRDREWLARATDQITRQAATPVRQVLFAGRVGSGRAVLVVLDGHPGRSAFSIAGYLSPGTDPQKLVPVTVPAVEVQDLDALPGRGAGPIAWKVRAADGAAYAVVLPGRGAGRIEVSPGPVYSRAGKVTRTYWPVPVRDGAAVTRLGNASLSIPRVRQGTQAPVPFELDLLLAGTEDRLADLPPDPGTGRRIDPDLAGNTLANLLALTDRRTTTVELAFLGPEPRSERQLLVARVRLAGGAVLHVVGTLTRPDPARPTQTAVTQPLAGRLATGSDPDREPIVWTDDLDENGGTTRARARVVQPGAARMTILDTGRSPCVPDRVLANAAAEPGGLTSLEVVVPPGCRPSEPTEVDPQRSLLSRFVVVTFGADGRELGRAPLALTSDVAVPDLP